jgi:tRNA threonylcarbamoyladenosine modification (KEOPS) complex  Pcc1 subunit
MSLELDNAKDYIDVMESKLNYKRSDVKVSIKGNELDITINAKDNVALLASMQSVLKRIRIISNIESIFTQGN